MNLRGRKQVYLSRALAGEYVGLREDNQIEDRWLVTFATLDLGHVEPGSNHFTPMSLVTPTSLAPSEA